MLPISDILIRRILDCITCKISHFINLINYEHNRIS